MNKNIISLLVAGLIVFPAAPAFAEEAPADPPADQTVSEPAPEPAPEPEEPGVWSVVDSSGNVTNAIMCTNDVCGDGSFGANICDGCTTVYQQPGNAGWHSQSGLDVTYDKETGTHNLSSQHTDEGGNEISSQFSYKDGNLTSVNEQIKIAIDDTEAMITSTKNYSIRQLADQNIEESLISVDYNGLSNESVLEYQDAEELVGSLEEDVQELFSDEEPSFIDSVIDLTNKIIDFFSNWIG